MLDHEQIERLRAGGAQYYPPARITLAKLWSYLMSTNLDRVWCVSNSYT